MRSWNADLTDIQMLDVDIVCHPVGVCDGDGRTIDVVIVGSLIILRIVEVLWQINQQTKLSISTSQFISCLRLSHLVFDSIQTV